MASGQFRKQDVSLIFGLQGGGSLSGESGALIKGQLETIVKRLNNSKDKNLQVALNLNVAQTKSNFKTALNDKVIPALQTQKASISLTLDKIDASSAIQNIKEELKNVLNSLSIKNGVRIEDLIDLTKDAQGVRALTDEEKRRLENLNALRKALNSTYNGAVKVASPEGLNNLERHQKDLQSLIKLMQEYASGIRNMSAADAQSGYDSLVKMAYELQKNLEIEKQGLSIEKQVTLEQEKQNRLLTEESSLILASNEATKKYGQSIKSAYDNLKTKAKTDADLSAITSIMTGSKENQEWFQINAELQKGVVLEESRRAQFVATGEVIRSQIEALNGLVAGQKAATSEFNASKIAVENLGGSVETLYKSMLKNASTTQDVGKIRAKLLQYKDLLEQIENIKSGNASYTNNEYYEIGKRIIALREELNILQQQLSTYDAVDQATKSVGQSVMNMYNGMLRGVSTDKELEKILAVSSQYSDWFKTEYALQNGLVQLTDEQARSHAKVGLEVKRVLSGLKEETAEYAKQNTLMKESARTSLANQIKGYISANPLVKNSREYGLLQKYYADLTSGQNMSESDGNNIAQAFSSIQAQMRTAKLEGNKLSTQLKDIFKQVTGFYSLATVVRNGYEQLRKMANAVKEIDTAMTELRKVTDETEVTYDKFLKNAAKRAKELGATVAETTNATADFARLGYDIEGAEALANTAIVYKNVGDGIKDISEASESIISTLQAFGIEAENAMSIVDKFNEVGNNFAISSQGIGEALLRSASALAAAGNTIDESIAMIAATNEVVQSPEKVGNALKTVSMYLRSSKVELEEAGESTEGMAESVSKLRDSILGLTGGEVDIQIDKDTYKGAYEIIAELSRVWDKISDINQAGILELIGGKRNANVTAALIENFETAEKVLLTSQDSAGSALAENEKYLDSIEGKISKFNASYEQLSTTTINSDFIKGLVDAGTEFLDVLNEIVDTLGSLASLVGVSGILGTISKHGLIKPGAMSMGIPQLAQSMASSVTSGVQTGINQLKNKQFLGAAQSVGGGIGNALSVGIGAALQTTAQTNFINEFDVIKKQGLEASEEQARINNLITNSAYRADAALHTVINTQNLQGKTTAEVTAMIHAQNAAWEKAKLKALAANLALTAGFVIIVSVITKAIEAAKRAKKAAIDAATDFDFLSSEISKTEEEYRKLNDVLVDNESSIDDINSAKESLLSLQDSLIDTYGKEAEGIDLVNGKYDEQIEKIRLLREEKAKDLIRENRTEYNKISDKLNEAYYPVSVGSNIVGSFNSTLQDAISTLDKNNESLSLVSDGSNTTAKVETTVKNGLKDLEILYDEFESLLAYVESDFERNYINGILNAISRSITEWKDKYEEDLAAYEKYGQAHAVANDTIISADNSNGDTVTTRVNDAYENYADAVEKYNDALKSGVDEEINAAKSRLDDMQLVIGRIRELDAGDFNLDEDSYNAMIDAFNAIESQIDRITEKKNAVKNDFESIQNGSRGTLEYLSDTGKTEVVDKNLFNSIKEMKMSMTEFDAFMNSDNGKNYFDTLNAAATSAELTLDELLSILRELGLFSNLESPISDEDIELYIKHKDALEDVVNGSKDVASLTDAERAAWERFNVVAAERNAKERELLALYQQTYSNDATTSVTALVSASDNLESALTKTEDALKDIDTVVKTVNGKMHLTDEQMVDLVSRHADLAEHLTWTEKGWTLEADAMDLVKDASANLQSAYITAQQKMTELCASGVGQRIEMYGIELRSMQSIMSAFSVGANGLVGMKLASSVYETEEGKAFADAALATGNTIVTDSSNEFEAESKAVVYAWRLNKQIEESLAAMEAAKSAADRTSGGGGKSVEKYKAEIDKLYKSLEKQKEIEEDIDNIQRERESFHEDDYLPYYMPKDSVNNAGKEVLDEYNAILNEIEQKGIDVNKTVYGNIDTNSRQVLEWTEQNLEKYRDEINSWTDWGQNADDYLGSYSTVDGRSSNFDGVEIAFTPILNTDNGPVYLSQDSVYEYIDRLIGAAGEGWTDEKLLELDARGMEIDGRRIRNLIAGIGEEAIKAGEAMHYVGKDGALAEAERRLAEYPVIILDETEAKKASSIQADKIKNIYKEISALERLNDTLHEQNEIRRSMINQNIADLQKYGFSVSYNSAYNELLINNYEELNTLVTSYAKRLGYGTEKTNELIKSVEALVQETHELNDANKENSATWQENTQAIKDYIKEIKNLKAEMVDDYLDKKENYLSHMQDFELWDAAKSVEYLEGMLHDLEDFYNAGLIDYEKFVEEYQAITKRIYDSRKDSLEYILDMVEDMIRQELEDQVDAYEEQKDALNDIIDAKKKIIQLAKEENDYNKSLEDKIKEMARLQERIAQLELDDSREASAEKAGLIEQLAELQSEVDSMQYDKSIEMQENALDEMGEANEKAIDKEIEQLEDLANNAEYIHDKTIEYIRENWDSLLSDLISYNNMYGDCIDENVTKNWENAKSALQEYRDAAWEVAKEMTSGQAVHGTVNEFMPVVGDTAQSVIAEANKAEISNIVSQMKAYAAQWSKASSSDVKADLANKAQQKAMELPSLGVEAWRNPTTGEWIIMRDDNNPSNVGQLLYDKYHTGGTVGELKNNELFALLEKGEDVLTEQQQRIAVPLLKAGIDMLNLSEGARSVFEFIKNMATPNLSMLRDSNESLVYAPEVNVTVTSNGGDADEIANAVKDRVLDAINGTFNKMGVSSKFKSIRV